MQNHTDPDGVGPDDAPEPEPATADAAPDERTPVDADPVEPTEAADAGQQIPEPSIPGPQPTSPGPQAGSGPVPPGGGRNAPGDRFFDAVRRAGVVRTDDRWVGGVCAGLAQRFGLDPLLVRGIVAATVLVGGFGLVAYGLAWALLPEARDGRIHLQETMAGRFDAAVLGALGMVLVGLVRGDGWLWWGRVPGVVQGLAWLAFLGVVVTVVVLTAKGSSDRRGLAPPAPMPPRPPDPAVDRPTAQYPTTYQAAAPTPQAPWGTGAPPAPASYTPPVAVATRQRRPGPGRTMVGVVVALTMVAAATLLLASRSGRLDAPVALVAAGVCVVLAGLGIAVSGLRGRRSGVLGFLAIVTLLVAGPWAVVEAGSWPHHHAQSVVTLADLDTARAGVDQGVGDIVVDLRALDLPGAAPAPQPSDDAGQATPEAETGSTPQDVPETPSTSPQTVRVPVSVGVGNVEILLPEGVRAQVEVEVGAGRVEWKVGGHQTLRGFGLQRTFRTDGDATPELVVHVSIGVGDLTISREGDR